MKVSEPCSEGYLLMKEPGLTSPSNIQGEPDKTDNILTSGEEKMRSELSALTAQNVLSIM